MAQELRPGRCLVQQVHGLVRQKPFRQIPAGQIHRRGNGFVGDFNAVMLFQPRPQALENLPGLLPCGFRHRHLTEPAVQSGVLLDVLAVFLQGSGADDLNLSAAQGGLQQIGGVNGPLSGAGPHNGMEFINKENHVAYPAHFGNQIPNALFKLAPVLGPGDDAGHIQGHKPFTPQNLRHLSQGQPLGQALHNGRLAHAGLANKGRVVLLLAAENLQDRFDFPFPANDRLHGGSLFHQIDTKLIDYSHKVAPASFKQSHRLGQWSVKHGITFIFHGQFSLQEEFYTFAIVPPYDTLYLF